MNDFLEVKGDDSKSAFDADKQVMEPKVQSDQRVKNILFFGDSLTAGYGLKASEAFPSLIQEKINSVRLKFKAINAGVSGETSSGGLYRINSYLNQPIDIFVLELGINDGLRGIPVAETKRNLQLIISKVKVNHPNARLVLAGMILPPYFPQKHLDDFKNMFPELAKDNSMALIPFLLKGVGGVRALNLPDGAHPSAAGQKIVAENVWAVLKDVIK